MSVWVNLAGTGLRQRIPYHVWISPLFICFIYLHVPGKRKKIQSTSYKLNANAEQQMIHFQQQLIHFLWHFATQYNSLVGYWKYLQELTNKAPANKKSFSQNKQLNNLFNSTSLVFNGKPDSHHHNDHALQLCDSGLWVNSPPPHSVYLCQRPSHILQIYGISISICWNSLYGCNEQQQWMGSEIKDTSVKTGTQTHTPLIRNIRASLQCAYRSDMTFH